MKALILVAHGSRRSASNDEIQTLTTELGKKLGSAFDIVETAFLEFAAPALPAALEGVIREGAESVRIVPYFLGSGSHVSRDVPQQVADVIDRFPEVDVTITPHIGASDEMLSALVNLART